MKQAALKQFLAQQANQIAVQNSLIAQSGFGVSEFKCFGSAG
ncbi:hypothetical protein [Acinetobacter sp. GSS19]|nr:hypothetical protein [Acinetobacter sp. GSS19]